MKEYEVNMKNLEISKKKTDKWKIGFFEAIIYRIIVVIFGGIICVTSIWVLGKNITYLWDENVVCGLTNCILSVLKIIGALFGIWISSRLLRYQLSNMKQNVLNYRLSCKNIIQYKKRMKEIEK